MIWVADEFGLFARIGSGGKLCVEHMASRKGPPWVAYHLNCAGHDKTIGRYPTEVEAKAAAKHFLELRIVGDQNALWEGCEQADEE